MRLHALVLSLLLVPAGPAAAAPKPLQFPVRAHGAHVAAPAYAGEVVEIQLAPAEARAAWLHDRSPAIRSRIGVPALDRAALELGGVRFSPLFHGERPPAADSPGPDLSAFYIGHLPPGLDLERVLDRLSGLPGVVRAEPVAIMPLSAPKAVPNDSLWSNASWFYQQPSRRDIHAPEAWDLTTGDTSVVVGILDTGVLAYHPDLGGSVEGLPGQIYTNWVEAAGVAGVDDDANGKIDDVHGWDFVNLASPSVVAGEDWRDEDNDPSDFVAHGTAVAGVVGALTNNSIGITGTSWNVRIMPLRIGWAYSGSTLGNGEVRMDFVAAAIHYAARMKVDVINCSFGSLNDAGLDAAIDAATAAGVTIVTSAGNNGQPNYIATRREVISVASVGPGDALSGFSNRGPQVDLAAPGQAIATTWLAPRPSTVDSIAQRQGSYATPSGTSFSAPLVAGAAALLQARQIQTGQPRLDPLSVLLRLFDTADDIRTENPGLDGLYGAGRLNAARALNETWVSRALPLSGKVVGAAAVFRAATGEPRVVVACDDRSLLVLDGASLDTLWKVTLPFAPVASPAVGPIGQGMGIFVGLTTGRVAGYRDDGSPLPQWPKFAASSSMRGGTVVWDLDGDGPPEVLAGSDDGRVWAWHVNGDPVTGFPVQVSSNPGGTRPLAVSHDLQPRIAAATEDGTVSVIDAQGNVVVGPLNYPGIPSPPVFANVAGAPAVVFAEGDNLHALGYDGNERPGFPVTLAAPLPNRGEVAVGDIDMNGVDDLVIAGSAPFTVEVRDSTGASLSSLGWPASLPSAPMGSVVLGHLTGGGAPELMVPLGSGVIGLSSSAARLWGFPKPGSGGTFPTLIDLDDDGTTEVLAGSATDRLLFSYDAGAGSASSAAQPWPTYRGDFQRTGSARDRLGVPIVDLVAPGAVTDLTATIVGPNTVRLRWTASGDDGAAGRARGYDIRRSTAPLTEAAFPTASHAPSTRPSAPGARDSVDVVGLPEGFTYYFALRVVDDGGNAGAMSNVDSVSLQIVSPAAVTDLRITAVTDTSVTMAWTATGASGSVGRPDLYVVRASTAPIDDSNFNQAAYSRNVPPTVDAGGTETYFFRFLTPATRYWFALKAYNDSGFPSLISNVVDAQTHPGGPVRTSGIALAPGSNPSRVPASLYWQSSPGATGASEIRIFDLTGRRIRTLELGSAVGGKAQWDGNDEDGRRVPAGLYLMRLISGSQRVQSRIVLLP